MNNLPRQKLQEIIKRYGQVIIDDPRRCRALLFDLCGGYKREIFVLTTALEERVPQDLLATSQSIPVTVLAAQLTKRLMENRALAKEASEWAVEAWGYALGIPVPAPKTTAQQTLDQRPPIRVTGPPPIPTTTIPTKQSSAQQTPKPNLRPTKKHPTSLTIPPGPKFSSNLQVDVMVASYDIPSPIWRKIGETPGHVAIPDNYAVHLRARALNDTRLAELMGDIKKYGQIQKLDISGNQALTDAGLAQLYTLSDLKSLDLAWCIKITDEGLARLRPLHRLQTLDLAWCNQITDNGLRHLRVFTQLSILRLEGCKQISDKGLSHIRDITSLTSLNLSRCPRITNEGLRLLRNLTKLTILNIGGCPHINRRGIAAIEHPGLTVDYA